MTVKLKSLLIDEITRQQKAFDKWMGIPAPSHEDKALNDIVRADWDARRLEKLNRIMLLQKALNEVGK